MTETNKDFTVGCLVEFCIDPRYLKFKKDGMSGTVEKHLGVLLSKPDNVGYVKIYWSRGYSEVHVDYILQNYQQ